MALSHGGVIWALTLVLHAVLTVAFAAPPITRTARLLVLSFKTTRYVKLCRCGQFGQERVQAIIMHRACVVHVCRGTHNRSNRAAGSSLDDADPPTMRCCNFTSNCAIAYSALNQ
jgi:hypothetical protein